MVSSSARRFRPGFFFHSCFAAENLPSLPCPPRGPCHGSAGPGSRAKNSSKSPTLNRSCLPSRLHGSWPLATSRSSERNDTFKYSHVCLVFNKPRRCGLGGVNVNIYSSMHMFFWPVPARRVPKNSGHALLLGERGRRSAANGVFLAARGEKCAAAATRFQRFCWLLRALACEFLYFVGFFLYFSTSWRAKMGGVGGAGVGAGDKAAKITYKPDRRDRQLGRDDSRTSSAAIRGPAYGNTGISACAYCRTAGPMADRFGIRAYGNTGRWSKLRLGFLNRGLGHGNQARSHRLAQMRP